MGRHRTGPLNCTICGKVSVGHGLCELHNRRLRKYGTTELPQGIIHRSHPLGTPEWQNMQDDPTYAVEYTGSIESLYALFKIHYRKPRDRRCIDCGVTLAHQYIENAGRCRPALRCRPCQAEDDKYPKL